MGRTKKYRKRRKEVTAVAGKTDVTDSNETSQKPPTSGSGERANPRPVFTLGPNNDSTPSVNESEDISSPESTPTTPDVISSSESRGSSSSNFLISQQINSKYVMIGSENNLIENTSQNAEENYSPSRAKDWMRLSSENKPRSFAQVCSGQNIYAHKVIINNTQKDAETVSSKQKQLHLFLDSVQNFNRGHYILVVEKLHTDTIQHLGSLMLAPWSVVLDLDPESRMTGLLSCAEHSVSKRKSLHVVSWQEKDKCNFNENSLYWIGMKGCSDRPGTRTDTNFRKWKAQIKGSFTQILHQLKKFGDSYTTFTVVSLWPRNHTEAQHMQYILEELGDNISPSPKMVLVDDSITKKTVDEDVVLRSTRLYHENNMTLVEMSITDVCRAVANVCKPLTEVSSSLYQLPTIDSSSHTDITDENAQWLKEDLDVLYIDNKTGTNYTQDELEKEEDTFFKGGALPWPWWYHVGPGHVDVERDITKRILDLIENKHIETCRPGCVTMLHNPGSGGTTLSQRVVWSLRGKVPCAQVKHRHGLNIADLTEKVKFLSDKTHLPILLLVIGEDEQMVVSIQRFVRDKCTVIIFYVKRSREHIDRDEVDREKSKCKLKSSVSLKEARQLGLLYKKQCKTEIKKKKITELVNDVEKGQKHTMFEFGLAVHSYNYHGIEPYVRDFLILQDTLKPWQTALAYMSLVYYYGQASVPCKFLAGFLGLDDADRILVYEDFPDEMKEFMVKDVQERKTNMVRITHYYVAKEILDQVLTFPNKHRRKSSPQICQESKRRLGSFAVNFIRKAGEIIKDEQATTISYIMTRTFILRDNKAAGENETETSKMMYPVIHLIQRGSTYLNS